MPRLLQSTQTKSGFLIIYSCCECLRRCVCWCMCAVESLSIFEIWLSNYNLHTHTRLLCFLTRQPDKLVVVWTRRSRRKSSKVCTEVKCTNKAKMFPVFCCRCLYFVLSPTAGSLALKTPTEEWWCGLCQKTSRSLSHFLRYKHTPVAFSHFHCVLFAVFVLKSFVRRLHLSLWLADLNMRCLYWLIGGQSLVTAVSVCYRSPTADVRQQTVSDAAWWEELWYFLTGVHHALVDGVYSHSGCVTVTLNSLSGNSCCHLWCCSRMCQVSTCSVTAALVCNFRFWILCMTTSFVQECQCVALRYAV